MRAIMVMFDTLNRHMLPPYGCDWVHAPNFAALAERTVVLDNCYAGSLACIPARRELHTGRYNFLHRGWGPLEPFDDSMPELLQRQGIYTHLVSDHQHYWEDGGSTYHQRYDTWEIVRGQEGDRWKGHVASPDIPDHHGSFWRQDAVNRQYMSEEADQSQARTFQLGLEFIEKNRSEDNWFLQIETFDPHEPFFTQQHYKDLYPHDYDGPHYDWPRHGAVRETSEALQHLRYEYAALLSMCDAYLGKILDAMDRHKLWGNTMLIVNTDHGFYLGEHGLQGEPGMLHNEMVHIPLFVWDPGLKQAGVRRSALVQTIDIAPTLLEFFGASIPPDMQGWSLTGVMDNDEPVREAALFGIHGSHVCCTNGRHVYMRAPANSRNQPLFEYTLMPTHRRNMFTPFELRSTALESALPFTKGCPVMKIEAVPQRRHRVPTETLLYDLNRDPAQTHPATDPEAEQNMIHLLVRLMKACDSPVEQFERLGLAPA